MKCEICGLGPPNGPTIWRVNKPGEMPARWRCGQHLDSDHKIEPELEHLVDAIEGKDELKKLFLAKPGDKIEIAGLPVEVKTTADCESAHIHICMRTADLRANWFPSTKGKCSRCGAEIWIATNSPTTPKKLCMQCARVYLEEESVTA